MKFSCPACNRRLEADDSVAETKVTCPVCDVAFMAPDKSADTGSKIKKLKRECIADLKAAFIIALLLCGLFLYLKISTSHKKPPSSATGSSLAIEGNGLLTDQYPKPSENVLHPIPNKLLLPRSRFGKPWGLPGRESIFTLKPNPAIAATPKKKKEDPLSSLPDEEQKYWRSLKANFKNKSYNEGSDFVYTYRRVPTKAEYFLILTNKYREFNFPDMEKLANESKDPLDKIRHKIYVDLFEEFQESYKRGCQEALKLLQDAASPAFEP